MLYGMYLWNNGTITLLSLHGLKLNINKTKELIADFSRKLQRSFHSLSISGDQEERVIASDTSVFMSPRHDPTTLLKKAHRGLFYFRQMRFLNSHSGRSGTSTPAL